MVITSIGSVGIGLMWGWLLILFGGRGHAKRPWRNILALGLATMLLALQLFLYSSWQTVLIFLVAAILSFAIHLAWHRALRSR